MPFRILTQQYHDLVNSGGVIIGAQVNRPARRQRTAHARRRRRPTIDKSNDSGVQRNEVFLVHLGCFTLTRVRTGAPRPQPSGRRYGRERKSPMTETPNAPAVEGTVQDPQANVVAIVGFVLAFVAPPIGIILSAIAVSKAGKTGIDSKLAKWGLALSIIFTVLYLIFVALGVVAALSLPAGSGA